MFNLTADFYERQIIIVTTNLELGQRASIFGDTRLTATLIDRIAHYSSIIYYPVYSNRLAEALRKK